MSTTPSSALQTTSLSRSSSSIGKTGGASVKMNGSIARQKTDMTFRTMTYETDAYATQIHNTSSVYSDKSRTAEYYSYESNGSTTQLYAQSRKERASSLAYSLPVAAQISFGSKSTNEVVSGNITSLNVNDLEEPPRANIIINPPTTLPLGSSGIVLGIIAVLYTLLLVIRKNTKREEL